MAGVLIVFALLTCVSGTIGVLDFTFCGNHRRILITEDDNLFIGGYKSGEDTSATVTFGRATDTGTGSGLPRGSREEDHAITTARRLHMPSQGGAERIGAFYCQAQKGFVTENITATIMASNSVITPDKISQTVSLGDSATFSVSTTLTELRWRHNGSEVISSWNNQKVIQLSNVDIRDGGIYECYNDGDRSDGRHAIIQLVVRACRSGRWGLPACTNVCPVCFNGGICDERSGDCVCAPGFSANYCETVHGSNRWGQDGQLICSMVNGNDPHSTACQGRLFCLPHPYGCSCAAGYHEIDCDQECQDGTYGANCESECHCDEGVSCLPDTGECSDGRCRPGWYGVNCQEINECISSPCLNGGVCADDINLYTCQCLSGFTGVDCQTKIICPAPSNVIATDIKWDSITYRWLMPPCDGSVSYKYAFTNNAGLSVSTGSTSSLTVTFTDLQPQTIYIFYVAAVTDEGEGSRSDVLTVLSDEREITVPEQLSHIDETQVTQRTIPIIIPQSTDEYVTGYKVGVQLKEERHNRQLSRFGHYFDSKTMYVAGELPKEDVVVDPVFLVGDGGIYGQYYNAPLMEGHTYTLYVAFIIQINSTSHEAVWSEGTDITTASCKTYSTNNSTWVTVVLAILVVIIVIIMTPVIGVMSFKIRSKNAQLEIYRQQTSSSKPPAISAKISNDAGQQINMSPDGYVIYAHERQESTYQQVVGEDALVEGTYEDIPAPAYQHDL